MARVTITDKEGRIYEVSDISIADVKELLSPNGHNGHVSPAKRSDVRKRPVTPEPEKPDYARFKKVLTEKAQKFFRLLHDNPNGITSDHLAEKMGFSSGSQIGGMTGGGIAKIAGRYGVDIKTLYRHEVRFTTTGRIVTYYPGADLNLVL